MNDVGLLSYDFAQVFPHLAWVSEWSADAQYPDGFQSKLLSSRRGP